MKSEKQIKERLKDILTCLDLNGATNKQKKLTQQDKKLRGKANLLKWVLDE